MLVWSAKSKKVSTQKPDSAFRSTPCALLFKEYTQRINNFIPCHISHSSVDALLEKSGPLGREGGGVNDWFCQIENPGQSLSSPQIAKKLADLKNSGSRGVRIFLGPPDGWPKELLDQVKKRSFLWSFGPITLPHELAAVVCSEQVYRAFTIIRGEPYHLGH